MIEYLDGFWSSGFWSWFKFMLDNAESRAVLFSILVAGAASFAGFLLNLNNSRKDERKAREQQRREHTIDIVLRMLTTKRLADPFQQVNRWIGSPESYEENDEFTEDQRKIIHPENKSDECSELLLLLGYYEFICQSFLSTEPSLDRDVILRQRKSAIRDGFAVLAPAIHLRRIEMHRDQQYEHFEILALYLMAIDLAALNEKKDNDKQKTYQQIKCLDIDAPLSNRDAPIVHSFRTYACRHRAKLIPKKWIEAVEKIARLEDRRLKKKGRPSNQDFKAVRSFFKVLDKYRAPPKLV